MKDNKKIYGEKAWTNLTHNILAPKISFLKEIIPDEVRSIIDVGCGNGVITNELASHYDVIGIDRSSEALANVKTQKIEASCDHIPLPDASADLVFSSELLEHLDDEVYANTVSEIKRLTKKYILITVPNQENPDKISIQCPKCNYLFNRPYHFRSFNIHKFEHDFSEFNILKHFEFGKRVRYYNPAILKIKLSISPAISWIPYYWIEKGKRDTMCPSCEHEFTYAYKFNLFAFLCDVVNVVISPKRPYWMFVLMEKKG